MLMHWMFCFLVLASAWQQGQTPAQSGSDTKAPYVEKSEKELAFYPGGSIEISAAAPGNVKVTGWQNAQVRVEIEKVFFYLSPEQARAASMQYPVGVTSTPTSVRVSTSGSRQPGATMEVNLQVYVPVQKTDLAIRMIKGDLAISAINGSMEATLEEGSLEAANIAGYFSGFTKRGDVTVDLSGKNWIGHSFTAATRQGNVSLRLPADFSATLQLETKAGHISIDYPPQIVDGESVPLQVSAKKLIRSVNAPIGAGGTTIKLMTQSGDIALISKK